MMKTIESIKSSDPRVAKIMRAIGSRKRSCYFAPYAYREGMTVTTGWQEGSCEEWSYVTASGIAMPLPLVLDPDRFNDPYRQRHTTPVWPAGAIAVVRHGISFGKPATPCIYLPPAV